MSESVYSSWRNRPMDCELCRHAATLAPDMSWLAKFLPYAFIVVLGLLYSAYRAYVLGVRSSEFWMILVYVVFIAFVVFCSAAGRQCLRCLVGHRVVAFHDDGRGFHVHEWNESIPEAEGVTGAGPYIAFRLGQGLFALKVELSCIHPGWRLQGTEEPHLFLFDHRGTGLTNLTLEGVLLITSRFPCFHEMVNAALNRQALLSRIEQIARDEDSFKERLAVAEELVDRFGIDMSLIISYMEESRETMGRSRHAQWARERLEESLSCCGYAKREKWKKAAVEKLRLEREAGVKPDAKQRAMKKPS